MTSFRHSKAVKELPTLDWIGLYEQLPPYSGWWKETAACAGIPLPDSRPDSVQFFYVNAADFAPTPTDKPSRMVSAVTYASREQARSPGCRTESRDALERRDGALVLAKACALLSLGLVLTQGAANMKRILSVALLGLLVSPIGCNPFAPDQSVELGVSKLDAP